MEDVSVEPIDRPQDPPPNPAPGEMRPPPSAGKEDRDVA